jgi:hypothetical protein
MYCCSDFDMKYDCTTCLLPELCAANGSWVSVGPLLV